MLGILSLSWAGSTKMKLAFVENRYKTLFWEALAHELKLLGCSIVWLVQNPVFAPKAENVYVMPFPRRRDLSTESARRFQRVRCADRNVNYFAGNDRHYGYYCKLIEVWLDSEQPDLVIGESTLFHELIAVECCRERGIPYLHPSMPGYPGGRYSVYAADTKETLGQSAGGPTDEECLALAEAIRKRERVPDYMQPPTVAASQNTYHAPRSLADRLMILRGFLAGERFNTPAPWRKVMLDLGVKRHLDRWKQLAARKAKSGQGRRIALYPLQMQPEANLDVWGQRFQNQAKLVEQIADALPAGWHLLVKANPKSKYELSLALMDTMERHPRISPVSLDEAMGQVLQRTDLVCTVTGTVAVECVLSGIPLVQFGPGIATAGPGCAFLQDIDQLGSVATAVEKGEFVLASDNARIDLVRRLYSTTFTGKVSDPMHTPGVLDGENVALVARNVFEVAKACK